METTINIAAVEETHWTTGPGCFLTVWVQGCRKRCPRCINSAYQAMVERRRVTAGALLDRLVPGTHEGICFSGGEPFLQADALAPLAERARQGAFGIVSYSGYTLEELEADGSAGSQRFLNTLDLLIDGPFIQDQAQPLLFRGSRNQRVHLLSPRYPRTILDHPPVTEMKLTTDGKITTVGTENPALNRIWSLLEQRGWHALDGAMKGIKDD